MTQPPSPSAAAQGTLNRIGQLLKGGRYIDALNCMEDYTKHVAAQALAAERAKPPASDARWISIEEIGNDNFATSIYENDYDGLLVARCNQNGNHPWQVAAILRGLERNRQPETVASEDEDKAAKKILGNWVAEQHKMLRLMGRSKDDFPELIWRIAAALTERGRVERERAAKIADEAAELLADSDIKFVSASVVASDLAKDIAAAIRNQTLTGD